MEGKNGSKKIGFLTGVLAAVVAAGIVFLIVASIARGSDLIAFISVAAQSGGGFFADGDVWITIAVIVGFVIFALIPMLLLVLVLWRQSARKFYSAAYIDKSTGVNNLQGFERSVEQVLRRAQLVKKGQKNKESLYALCALSLRKIPLLYNAYGLEVLDDIMRFIIADLKKVLPSNTVFGYQNFTFFGFCKITGESEISSYIDAFEHCGGEFSTAAERLKLDYIAGINVLSIKEMDTVVGELENTMNAMNDSEKTQQWVTFVTPAMRNRRIRERMIGLRMESALLDNEFFVHYQPRFDVKRGFKCGEEALARWTSKELGVLTPSEFIPVFEKNGFILELDFYIVEQVLKYLQKQIKGGKKPFPVSINQSAAHLGQIGYAEKLVSLIDKYKIPHSLVEIEITETVFSDPVQVQFLAEQLKTFGLRLAVDGFGGGYSSLSVITGTSISTIVLDRSFADKLDNYKSKILLKGIVEMAKQMDVELVAAGVDTKKQEMFMEEIGVRTCQGELYK